ncbi:MAG: YHS domain-containing protein [Thaumarchaeota archaeon]|jgi:YHS domain-containing protein|nr:YHS domain-containing protein [Candidatus Geocrenenecus arthurdayi]MCL7388689.1 YHS domain-containing protein [Candidatus Geocrenenecus arthurdayi]MCL7390986.1 YHS domain-containing protein [Candidatus Geocrenenecus arthurdayi]MCL7396173.1 YHS domain-containing protein [Candidatus Geocrenenecus arthurdayi]MCL7403210.1 YHS domain-containing protein [Candidatus Geocrenenecus arthurdayi]
MSRKNKAVDPVCGMEIERGKISTTYEGATYYFCSEECRREFEKNPGKYITESSPARNIEMHRHSTHHCC